jgi:PKD repeat protein
MRSFSGALIVGRESVPAAGRESWAWDFGNASGVDGSDNRPTAPPVTEALHAVLIAVEVGNRERYATIKS